MLVFRPHFGHGFFVLPQWQEEGAPVVKRLLGISIVLGAVSAAGAAKAHPHVFVEPHVEIVGNGQGMFTALRNVWRMDELFSSSVVVDFDKNANGVLDPDELDAVGETVRKSIAEWNFYSFAEVDGKAIALTPPDTLHTLFEDGQLIFFFEMPVTRPVDLTRQTVKVSNFDESFFVAFDFKGADDFQLVDMPAGCRKAIHVPDEDQAAKAWMEKIAGLGVDEQVPQDQANAFADILATRLEVSCSRPS
ncbi:DUF1007 family protein [Jiella sp. MQZ9-1]|uniref:DUF1007 family protein n=1 Tax=Jiella flava TaxID=2816857 RepID=A0A939JWH5_9HYPH|nr:DUF1007 family protein [Jiella flava]MBO0663052.1 DUF1007 family protein [Jiella flava]MCD2471471.1 DUF1007 family protein [Jiella flava]